MLTANADQVGGYTYTNGRSNELGFGRLNACRAVSHVLPTIATLSGPSTVCSSGTQFTVNNVSGCTVSWTRSTNITFDNQTGNPKVFTANATGAGWIRPTVISNCFQFDLPQKNVWVGPYSSSNYPITGPGSAPCRQNVYYSIPALEDVISINWVWPSGWTYVSGQGTRYLALQTGTTGSGGIVGAQVVNICLNPGSYATMYTSVTGICGYSLTVSPNPAIGEATIELNSDSKETLTGTDEWELDIYDSMQGLKEKKANLNTAQTKINTTGWKDGVYVVRAKIGDEVITEKLVVKH